MCAYQEPDYVKRFVGRALSGIESVQFFFEEVRIPHIRLKADYGVEDIVIEAKPPCGRVKDREQVKKYEELHAGLTGVSVGKSPPPLAARRVGLGGGVRPCSGFY